MYICVATLESEPCGGIVVPAALMETIITFYCKSRNTKYPGDGGYAEVLLPLIKTGMTKTDIYNCFYTILNRHIPRYPRTYVDIHRVHVRTYPRPRGSLMKGGMPSGKKEKK